MECSCFLPYTISDTVPSASRVPPGTEGESHSSWGAQSFGTTNLLCPLCPGWSLTAFSCRQHTPLCSPGIYIRTLIEDGPAATDGRLSIGDRILAVNGTSLIGADYQR